MNKGILPIILAVLTIGCIHDYPHFTPQGEKGIDPTLVQIIPEIYINHTFDSLIPSTKTLSENLTVHDFRIIIAYLRNGETAKRQTIIISPEQVKNGKIKIQEPQQLHAVDYTMIVWADYVPKNSCTDLHYNTKDINNITCTEPYQYGTESKNCFHSIIPLDLRSYREQWNTQIPIEIHLERPQAKYRIIASDTKKFLYNSPINYEADDIFTAVVSYHFFFPMVFNGVTGKLSDVWTNVSYSMPFKLKNTQTETTICLDYIFAEKEENAVSISLDIQDKYGNIISHIPNLQIHYKRGYQTTIKGNFLTGNPNGGMAINYEYEDEINIDLDHIF